MEKTQGIPIIRTKIMIPSIRPGMVHREKLIRQIEDGISQGFILVSAPPGYGKTTLVADWAQQSKSPVCWLTLDRQDNDLMTLNRYFLSMIEEAKTQTESIHMDFALENNALENLQVLIIALINECTRIDTEFTLVLDDFQAIQNPKIHKGIHFLLEHFPEHFRLIIIARCDPPFQLARLSANNRILEIRSADLCFTLPEAKEFLNQTVHLQIPEADLKQVHERTEGWITGLQLEAISHNENTHSQLPGRTSSGNPKVTMDYMIEEVFYRQSLHIQDFLLKTSILDNLNGDLCDALLRPYGFVEDNQHMLLTLYHSNLFLTSLDQEETWFRYHPLFSQALRSLLKEKLASEIPALYTRASEWCDQNGLFEEALTYANETKDQARYISLLEKYSLFAIGNGSILDTLSWVKRINENLIATSSLLSLIFSWGLMMAVELDSSEIWLEKAKDLLTIGKISEILNPFENDLWGLIYAAQSMLSALRGNIDQALTFSTQAMQLLPEENSFSHCFALLNRGFTFSLNGNLDQAIQVFEETIQASQKSGNWITLLVARSNLAELLIDKGKLTQALLLFQQSLKYLPPSPEKSSGFRGYLFKEMGEVYLIRNQLSEASQYLLQGAELTRNWLPSLNDLDTHVRLAHLYHCQGNFPSSIEEIAHARKIANTSQGQLDDLILDLSETKLALLRGQTSLAQKWLQKQELLKDGYQKVIDRFPVAISVPAHLVLTRFFLVQGRQINDHAQINRAIQVVRPLIPLLEKTGLVDYQIEAYTLLALAYHELGQLNDMQTILEKAFQLSEPEEIRQVFLDEGIPMSRLLMHYLAYMKQNKINDGIPSRNFLTDLLFRLSGKEVETSETAKPGVDKLTDGQFINDTLTTREIEVIRLVASGRTNNEIAALLHLSINTVKRHLNNIFLKLGVATRTQAILVARKQGWIQ